MKHLEMRDDDDQFDYLIDSHQEWLPCELVTRNSAASITPSEAKCVCVVDRAIWNMILGIMEER